MVDYSPKPGASSLMQQAQQAGDPAAGKQPVVQQARTTTAPLATSTPKTTHRAGPSSVGVQTAQPTPQMASPQAGINKPAGQATVAVAPAHSAIARALDLAKLGQAHLAAIETALVPAYRGAVKAAWAA